MKSTDCHLLWNQSTRRKESLAEKTQSSTFYRKTELGIFRVSSLLLSYWLQISVSSLFLFRLIAWTFYALTSTAWERKVLFDRCEDLRRYFGWTCSCTNLGGRSFLCSRTLFRNALKLNEALDSYLRLKIGLINIACKFQVLSYRKHDHWTMQSFS